MRKRTLLAGIIILTFIVFATVSCGVSSLSSEVVDEGHMVITAEGAAEDDFVVTGTLVVKEDQQMVIDSALEPGAIRLEFISDEGFDDIDEIPEETKPVYTANVKDVESQAVFFGQGEYMVRVTVMEKATGTVDVQVKGLGEESEE